MSIILGIDPGSRCTGYGIVRAQKQKLQYLSSGFIRLSQEDMAQRLHHLYHTLTELIQTYQVQEAAIEQVFLHANVNSALKLGQARGAALAACGQFAASVAEYTARQIKQSVVGYGQADKIQVQDMVKMLLLLPNLPQADEADALAAAICHSHYQANGALANKRLRRGRMR